MKVSNNDTFFKFIKIRGVKSPNRGTQESAGIDFYVPDGISEFSLGSGLSINIPSGIKMIIPKGYSGIFFNKSGVGVKGVLVGAQVVDSDYRGEVHLNIHNTSPNAISFKPGQKLVQMVVLPISLVEPLEISGIEYNLESSTERGTGGFGSTGLT